MRSSGTVLNVGSKIWHLAPHPLYRGSDLTINWNSFLPPSSGTKHQREYLKKSSKEYLLSWISYAESRYGVLSPGTVKLRFRRLKVLSKWLVENDIWRYSVISEQCILDFLTSRVIRRDDDEKHSQEQGRKDSLKGYLSLFDNMWILRGHYAASLKVDPRTITEIESIKRRALDNQRWLPIEQQKAVVLLRDALKWQQSYEYLIDLSEKLWAERKKWIGLTKHFRIRRSAKFFEQLKDSASGKQIEDLVDYRDGSFAVVFGEAVRAALGASLLIILFFTGMRISEVMSLKSGCLTEKKHSDGKRYWYVRGVACKKKGKERLWIVPDPVVATIKFVDRFYKSVRERYGIESLFLTRFGGSAVLTGLQQPYMMRSQSAAKLMRHFLSNYVEVEVRSLCKEFHAHRARKTFARFIALRNKSALESLAYHYGHLYVGVLDSAYVGTDFELRELLREEREQDVRKGLTSLFNATVLGGKAGEKFARLRGEMKGDKKFKGKAAVEAMVDKLISDGVILAPCEWGFCVYVQDLSMCKGSDVMPSNERRAPSICASCSNFAVTNHHLPWWERRYKEEEEFLERSDLPAQTRRVVEYQLDATANVLRKVINLNERKVQK